MTVDDLGGAWPSGLPVGDGWVETEQSGEVVFPYDGSVVASAPVGTPDLARRASANR
ncbi:hypothetical protein [Nonomuraea sp. NPDC050691]|uniref:hypothetical protein n=1 Tax=Nonomuraea sp. NPDC050691 TaxID=3155661 RepID=UPI0033F82876